MANRIMFHQTIVIIFGCFYILNAILTMGSFVSVGSFNLLFISVVNVSVGSLAIYAVKKKDGSKMNMFGVAVIVLMSALLLALLLLVAFVCKKPSIVDSVITYLMNTYHTSSSSTLLMDSLQAKFKCCGKHNPTEWTTIPSSCCERMNTMMVCDSYYQSGCAEKSAYFILALAVISGIICILKIIFHALTTRSAYILAKTYNESK